jgi:hypothetical protein
MKSFASALLVLVPVAGLGAFLGCAEGTEIDPDEVYLSATEVDAGKQEDDGVKLPPKSMPEEDASDDDDGTRGDGGSDAGADSGSKPDSGGGGSVACTAPKNCAGATGLGLVSGDTGSDVKTAEGHTSQWFTVRATEDDSDIAAVSMRLSVTLTSPAGTNFDLYVYVPSGDTTECSAVSHQSTSSGTTDSVKATFGESGLFANGTDDDRTVTVEVRHVSGTCDPTKKWTLNVAGNK